MDQIEELREKGHYVHPDTGAGWIGVDLDGTLSRTGTFPEIGEPIPAMVERVRRWLSEGKEVRIFTARVGPCTNREIQAVPGHTCRTADDWIEYQERLIRKWCKLHLGQQLAVTASKDFRMLMLWDDRAVQTVTDTGETFFEHLKNWFNKATLGLS